MKRFFSYIFAITLPFICFSVGHASASSDEFPMPSIPEKFDSPVDRADYIVTHFWDRVKLNTAIKNRDGFNDAFSKYVMQMPMASAAAAQNSVSALIKAFEKDPKGMLMLAETAERYLYSPESIIVSDELYLPFAQAVVKAKKLSSAEKARFARQVDILAGTKVGGEICDFSFVTTDGKNHKLSDYKGKYIVVFVNDPDCDECRLARVRLSTETAINSFIDKGQLVFISIYPDEPTDEWRKQVSSYNKRWVVASSENVDDVLDLRSTPSIYYINPKMKILSKTIAVDQLIDGFIRANSKQ